MGYRGQVVKDDTFHTLQDKGAHHGTGSHLLKEIWRLYGLPERIISDRDTRFISKSWMSLMQQLQVLLK